MAIVQDDRTPEQKKTLTYLIGGRDRMLSGWGEAPRGSWAFWACEQKDFDRVWAWVESRSDITRQTYYTNKVPTKPKGGHVHIYPVYPGHPALGKE